MDFSYLLHPVITNVLRTTNVTILTLKSVSSELLLHNISECETFEGLDCNKQA
jgi:hypothetical protein